MQQQEFLPTRHALGYDQREVDELLDRAAVTLRLHESGEGQAATLSSSCVEAASFTPVRMMAGSDMREVDAFLDRLTTVLRAHEDRDA